MHTYLMSLGAGLLVGVIYSLLQVRSPAPPVIALLGLLGMLAGEQIVPTVKRLLFPQTAMESSPAEEGAGADAGKGGGPDRFHPSE